MHKSMILGIIGCCLAAVSGIVMILASVWMGSLFSSPLFFDSVPDPMFSDMFSSVFSNMTTLYIVIGSVAIASVIPGVIGCVMFKKNRHTAGILFIVAACLSIMTALIAGVLFLLAGIFALSKDKPAAQPLTAPPPPAYRAPYPPYAAYPPPPAYSAYPPPTAPPYPPYGTQPVPPYPPYGMQQPTPPPPTGNGEQ